MEEQKENVTVLKYPVIHRRKVPFRPHLEASDSFSKRVTRIRQLDSELDRFFPSQSDYLELVEEAYSSNIHFSTKLEGNPLPLAAVRRLTRRSLREGHPEGRPTFPNQEILNHLILWLAPEITTPPWSLDALQGLHKALLFGAPKEARAGLLRDHESAIYSDENQEVFVTCHPKHIRSEMHSLLEWATRTAPSLDPIAGGAVFFHEFESIHPFSDGNGRLGRTLFHAYLQHRGLPNAHLCIVEKELLEDPEEYYRVLASTDQEGRYDLLLDYFSRALLRSYEDAVERFRKKDIASSKLPEGVRRLLIAAKHHEAWFTVNEATGWVQGSSDQTVRNHLNDLIEMKMVRSRGNTRAKRYQFVIPLAELKKVMKKMVRDPTFRKTIEELGSPGERQVSN